MLVLGAGPVLRGQAVVTDPELAAGLVQVSEGDFETAVVTLEAVVGRLAKDATRSKDLVQALLNLGVAHVALGHVDQAQARFRGALERDPSLRLGPDRFSPKVIAVFEAARQELKTAGATTRKGRSKAPLVLLGAAGAAGAAVLATRGGDAPSDGPSSFANARFATPVIVCPDDSRSVPVPFTIVLNGTNGGSGTLRIDSVSSTLIIKTSSIPSEIDFASSSPSQVTPSSLGSRATVQLTVSSTLSCDNGAGDAPRFNEWLGRVTVSTPAGVFTLETSDRIRVNIP